ncbi:hypothetical protein FGIG_00400 [Fasciola gigantica]|uniref:HCLS1-associated protein X-1 n=1 Tax=Fasciola gigantica TaxID=46835 RepID=A0A504YTX8_FASGI|nr:hypothetical protein FGIG_00400 [Fasciola gigantica]
MDRMFEHIQRAFDEFVFSGFFDAQRDRGRLESLLSLILVPGKPSTPRDEMLREREDDEGQLHGEHVLPVPEPWTPFPFFGDLVKPDVMDRDFFRESQWQRKQDDSARKDIILDDDAPMGDILLSQPSVRVRKWSQSFSRKTIIGPNGERIETETKVTHEPDGTQIHTTVEKSPRGERKRTTRRNPDGREETEESDTMFSAIEDSTSPAASSAPSDSRAQMHHSDTEVQPGGIFDSIRRWFRG